MPTRFGTKRYGSNRRQAPQLNMAPLIDMVFLLLIFFMVTTTFKEELGVVIDKPEAAASDVLALDNMIFGVGDDDRYYYGDDPITLTDAREKVLERLVKRPNATIIIMADRNSRTEAVIDILDVCKSAGAKNLSIATRRPPRGAP